MIREGQLILSDGSTFEGELIGAYPANGIATGEVVFNTALSGYQEIITDPSYAGQIVTFTYPHIGNYGINSIDAESRSAFTRGIIVRDLARRPSNYRASGALDDLLEQLGIPGIAGIDTRRLTKLLRDEGSMIGGFGDADASSLSAAVSQEPGTDGVDLVATVTTPHPYLIEAAGGAPERLIVAYDFGIKTSILRDLSRLGAVQVVPADTPAEEVLALRPNGVFLSNGPGDPRLLNSVIANIADLVGRVPIFGICLGFQLLGLAVGAEVIKMPFGHHGANHPVRREDTGEVEITSQNHNYAIDAATFAGLNASVRQTHINLNDGVCEGLEVEGMGCFGVQHHPEAAPGPHDSKYLFGLFDELMADDSTMVGGS